ncbi:hypothetical protein KY330_05085 [Candidatus Woesearchaeota archaeon]|nr:hypothetical protein [Candidatus Woesearchaeota archaeon]
MGARGILRDILVIILFYLIIKAWIFKEGITSTIGLTTLLLFALSVWFLVERIGMV